MREEEYALVLKDEKKILQAIRRRESRTFSWKAVAATGETKDAKSCHAFSLFRHARKKTKTQQPITKDHEDMWTICLTP